MITGAGLVCLQSGAGRAKQMNMGTQNSISDIILYLHIDTAVSSSNISNIKKTYKQGFLSGRFNIRLSNNAITYRIISVFINIRSCVTKVSTGDQGIFVTRKAYEAVGGIPDIALMEDIAFTKSLKKLGKVACLKDVLITSSRRWEQFGVVRTIILMWKLRLLFWLGVSPDRLAKMYKDAR
jgi:rSAM/selenodomain-associated transferase 2